MFLSGCASKPSHVPTSNQVEIAQNVWVDMPKPADLGYSLTASQLISVQYKNTQNQLPIQLQVSPQKLVLAGFSSWGSRLLSLTYQDGKIDIDVMAGLGNALPKPEQVLFNLMITLWPLEVWQQPLSQVHWQLTEHINSDPKTNIQTKQRTLIDDQGKIMATIDYSSVDPLKGDISFINQQLGFTIKIKTLQYNQD
ncbi:hypothetical protein A1QC_08710 [Vibrio rumoiensis 1S-45]|uniref:DUF3261 domain-containing protein n=2 Tax=Vibrio rumoiensis TaxID=76258 RepID=A0A1E5E248_9VIBR|nr:hypothetical protein A1QC_08710 [Vibrio rumoiensis 1S-45]